MNISRTLAPVILGLAAGLALTACGSSSHHSADAAKASALASNTAVQQDTSQVETALTTNLQKEVAAHPAHPVSDVKAAIKDTFPAGDTAKIEAYAVKEFTPAVITTKGPGSARDLWAQKVAAYASSSGASASPDPIGTSSTADIPGFTSPSPKASVSP